MIEVTLTGSEWDQVDESSEAILDQWLVGPGDTVGRGQALAVVMLAKAAFEVEAPAGGRMHQLLVPAEGALRRGQVIALIEPAETQNS